MNYEKDRRLVWSLSLIFFVGLVGMVLSVVGFDKSGLTVEALAVLLGVCGAGITVLEVVRSPAVNEQRISVKRPPQSHPKR